MKPVRLLGISRGREDRWRWVKAQCALNSLSTFVAIQSQRTIPPLVRFQRTSSDDTRGRGRNFLPSRESNLLRGDA